MNQQKLIETIFYECANEASSIEYYSALRKLANQYSHVTELGAYHLGSSFAILLGLLENPSPSKSLLAIDCGIPPKYRLQLAQTAAKQIGIQFSFLQANDFDIELQPTDMLNIDTYHTYRHLTYELEKFSPIVRSTIVLHDTSAPFGYYDENAHAPNWDIESRYPPHIDRTKMGLWSAVTDFLKLHPEWELIERNTNGPGFTVLRRTIY